MGLSVSWLGSYVAYWVCDCKLGVGFGTGFVCFLVGVRFGIGFVCLLVGSYVIMPINSGYGASVGVVPWVICFMFGGGVGVGLFSCDKYLY